MFDVSTLESVDVRFVVDRRFDGDHLDHDLVVDLGQTTAVNIDVDFHYFVDCWLDNPVDHDL